MVARDKAWGGGVFSTGKFLPVTDPQFPILAARARQGHYLDGNHLLPTFVSAQTPFLQTVQPSPRGREVGGSKGKLLRTYLVGLGNYSQNHTLPGAQKKRPKVHTGALLSHFR